MSKNTEDIDLESIKYKELSDIKSYFRSSDSNLNQNNFLNVDGQSNLQKLEDFTLSLVNHFTNWGDCKGFTYPNGEFGVEYANNELKIGTQLQLTSNALNQICQSRTVAIKGSYLNSLPMFMNEINERGESVPVNIRQLLFNEIFSTRTHKFHRIFREVEKSVFDDDTGGKIVCGVVGKNYPVDYSDYKQVNSISNHLNDMGVGFKYAQSSIDLNGDVTFTWQLDEQFTKGNIENPTGAGLGLRIDRGVMMNTFDSNLPSTGIYYYNNFAGSGSLSFSQYSFQLICSNGMIGRMFSKLTEKIEHMTLNSFVRKLVHDVFNWKKEEIILFKQKTGFDYTLPDKAIDYKNFLIGTNGTIKDELYDLIAKNVIFKSLLVGGDVRDKYLASTELILEDWKNELESIAYRKGLSKTAINELINVGINEPTIKLNIDTKPAEYTAIIDTFSSSANYYQSKGNNSRSFLYREIAGDLLARSKPITQIITAK